MGLFDFVKKKELDEIERLRTMLEKYSSIIDVESEFKRLSDELDAETLKKKSDIGELEASYKKLNADYQDAINLYNKLKKEVGIYESKLDLIEFGVYEPIYQFEKSEEYRNEQNRIIELQKQLIKSEQAAICKTKWTIDGSLSKGEASTKKYIKLVLRAFNGECDSLIAKVKWNNVNQMRERIKKSFETLNKISESQTVSIQTEYLDLKIQELQLEYEYQLKKQQEKEELRAAQEAIREEEKAFREFEQAKQEAEKEEANYKKALEKARREIEFSTGEKHDKLEEQIKKLEQELKEANDRKERAISMAQQTKRGHVYVISNIGSFGEEVHKIGMTRRLEPEDRIRELGDASVPFHFDIHALIFSEDAPRLESELHKAFNSRKVNMLNFRKEFFKVSLDEIEQKVKELGLETTFIRTPEAIEFRETLSILAKMNSSDSEISVNKVEENDFPNSLFNPIRE